MNKYVLPFFGFNENIERSEFIGSSFIIKPNLLITAGHNILNDFGKSFKNYSIKIDNKFIDLGESLYSKYNPLLINEGDYEDLAIFQLNKKFQDSFILSSQPLLKEMSYELYGYISNANEIDYHIYEKNVFISIPDYSFRLYPSDKGRLHSSKYTNCFNVKESLLPSLSGAPIFKNNEVVGMVVYGFVEEKNKYKLGASALKASYIKDVLKNL